jgi:hypothetical protein
VVIVYVLLRLDRRLANDEAPRECKYIENGLTLVAVYNRERITGIEGGFISEL